MRKKWRYLAVLLALLLSLGPISPAAYGEPEAVQAARAGVAHLYGMGVDSETGTRLRWTGTGIAVGIAGEETDVFLTNRHVLSGNGRCSRESVQLWILKDNAAFDSDGSPLPDSAVLCRVLRTTDGYPDVAVLQAQQPVSGFRALALRSSRRIADGTVVYAMGFPGISHLNQSAPEDVTVTEGTVQQHLRMQSAGDTHSLIHSAAIAPGFSGGPLVDEAGAVVAENAYGFEEDVTTSLFCAVYIDYAMDMLEELGIPYTASAGDSVVRVFLANLLHSPKLNIYLAYFFILAGILAISLWILYYSKHVYTRRSRRKPDEEP